MNKKYEVVFKEEQPAEMAVQIQPKTNDIHVAMFLPSTKTVLYLILSDTKCDDQFSSNTIHFMGPDIDVIVFMTCKEEAFSKIIQDQLDENMAVLNRPERDDDGFIILQWRRQRTVQDVKICVCKQLRGIQPAHTTEEYLRAFLAELQLDRDVSITIKPVEIDINWRTVRKRKTSDFIIYNEIMSLKPKDVIVPEEMIMQISHAFTKFYKTTAGFYGYIIPR